MIAVFEEDWGVSDSDCYPPRDKYGWRDYGVDNDEAEEKAKLDQENKEKRSWWDKFWES